jgi:Fe-S oxidoreductase
LSEMQGHKGLEQLANCALCANMCKHSCPTYLASGSETITPQKLARLILYEEKGFLEDRQGFFEVVFQSAMCGACKVHCMYEDYDLRRFIQTGRSKAFEAGILPEETKKRLERFTRFGNPHGERELLEKGTGEVGHFISCSAYKDQQLPEAMGRIIAASKDEVQQFGGADICCGAPLYYAGDTNGFKKAAEKMRGEFEKRKLRKVVADCPTCVKMLTQVYREVGVDLEVEIVHTTQLLDALLKEGKIRAGEGKGTATYHDPCILANDVGVIAAPRDTLTALGFEIREPVYSSEDTHCCGGPEGVKIGDRRLTEKVSSMRVGELKATGADVYVSACPTCKAVLSELRIKDITEVVAEHIV